MITRRSRGGVDSINRTSLMCNIIAYYRFLLAYFLCYIFTASVSAETLSKLNISIDALPQRCQEFLQKAAAVQSTMDIKLDPVAIFLQQSNQLSDNMDEEYKILQLEQRNAKLQMEVDRNEKFLDGLRMELQSSRDSLAECNPSPENIQEYIKQMRQKVAAYEEGYKKATAKFSKLSVPDSEMPDRLRAQIAALEMLKADEAQWRLKADDALFESRARDTFSRLRR